MQCDQISRFYKVWATNFLAKVAEVAEVFGDILGNFWKHFAYFLFRHLVTLIVTRYLGAFCLYSENLVAQVPKLCIKVLTLFMALGVSSFLFF